jgi:Tfp pilus assembly protein PilN
MLFNLSHAQGEALKEILFDRVRLEVFLNDRPLGRILFTSSAARGVEEAQTQGISFSKLFAAASCRDRAVIDFSPAHVRRERIVGIQRKEFSKILALSFAVIAVALLILVAKIHISELRLKSINNQIAVLETEAIPLQSMLKRIRLIDKAREKSHSVMPAIRDVLQKVPVGVYLSEITYVRDTVLSIRGTSRDNAQVFLFVESLKKELRFRDVQVKYVTKRKDINDFEVSCLFTASAK